MPRPPRLIAPTLACLLLAVSAAPAAAQRGHRAHAARSGSCARARGRAHGRRRDDCATNVSRTGGTEAVPPRAQRSRGHAHDAHSQAHDTHALATVSPPPPVTPPAGTQSAAAIAAVLSTPCQNTELTPEAGNTTLVRAAVLCLINQKRAEENESPLRVNPDLEQAAEGHCQELIADDYFAHVSPSGETPVQRIEDTGYVPSPEVGYVLGENLAWGTYDLSTPKAIVAAWIASPGHLANILESKYTETGIGVTPAVPASLGAGAPGATYAQEFGVILH